MHRNATLRSGHRKVRVTRWPHSRWRWVFGSALVLSACGGGIPARSGTVAATALGQAAPVPTAPVVPRAGLDASELAVVVAEGDPTSEAIGRAYQRVRGIPDAQVFRIAVDTQADAISVEAFQRAKAELDRRLPAHVQALLLGFTRPSRVEGPCAMSITSALAFGYDPAYCGGCSATRGSPYFDSESTRPFTDFGIRPAMVLAAASLADAERLMARGKAADGSFPSGTGWLLRTADAARSVRHSDWSELPALWGGDAPLLDLRHVDARQNPQAQALKDETDVLFYFTGLVQVPDLATLRWRPGAVADHLTSTGGLLMDGAGQMPATAWLASGATASYGTVEEPCNRPDKFPKVSVLLNHYLRGATVLEAYWKSVQQPGQGLFIGEPLARPWPDAPVSRLSEAGELVIHSRNWRRGAVYTVEVGNGDGAPWTVLDTRVADQGPRPHTWRVTLPPGTRALRVRGPCTTAPALTCTWGTDD